VERRPFANMVDLNKFLSQTLDGKQLTELYPKMFIQLNLNTATREQIQVRLQETDNEPEAVWLERE
jgi:hypothetical protein